MTYLYQNPLIVVAILTFLLSPFILSIASKQNKENKKILKLIYIFILFAQILLGFFNWENFSVGRSGFEISFTYPDSFLGLFFIIPHLQIILLLLNKSFNTSVIILNFVNTVLIFIAMIRLSNIFGFQAVSFASIGTVFLVLFGNVIGLSFINKDKYLLK